MSELISSAQSWLSAALASLVVLIAVFVPLERLFPARQQPIFRPALVTDAAYFFGQYLLWNVLSISLLRFVTAHLGTKPFISAPKIVLFLGSVVLGDVLVYWFHRACHASNLLWRFHSVHHSSEHLDWLAAHREHPVDGMLTQLMQNLPAILLGVPMGGLAGLAVFRGMWAIFIHSNVRLPIGPLRYLLGSPELHHWHHARGHGLTNFGNLAPWLDIVFGTHEVPTGKEYPLGISNHRPQSWLASMWTPFVP